MGHLLLRERRNSVHLILMRNVQHKPPNVMVVEDAKALIVRPHFLG